MEGETIQFKTKLLQGNEDLLARILVALSNSSGGYLIIGVTELTKGCIIVGISESENEIRSYLNNAISKYTIGLKYVLSFENVENKHIAIVRIEHSDSIVYYSRRETSPERQISYVLSGGKIVAADKMLYKRVFKLDKTEQVPPLETVKSVQFWS